MNDQISSAGLELANVLVTSPLLHQSWNAVLDQKQKLPPAADPNQKMALDISETKHSNITIISFLASPVTLQNRQVIISLTPKDTYFPLFEFLCNKNTPSFTVNELAITLFALNHNRLVRLRTRLVESSKPDSLILITGHSFGGSVATLFTLWLLQSLDLSKAKRPLCITFGSPLIGDEQLRQCVSQSAQIQGFDYGQILNDLKIKAFSRDIFELVEEDRVPLKAGIKTQLAAILGVLSSQSLQQQQPNIEFESLIKKMVTHERKLVIQKTKVYSSFLKLNEAKKDMANMEWYKKHSKHKGIGYYDGYRNKLG
ncbi:senescence-associated carboxylesterase 101-like [Pyrus ussuriensis x Pyrus communis]|uniref:Senescence-associated carboxylesterase 101-like n=1 Tax=Pyrus ussuriensis x Pyrus communis TaxID=2448454 RepID=A0A5N5HC09_9ROSA|nr:senescence-associated carboxylesterase 101-like [Pyrus ussuriensis x Pyrus communis]